jgi:hypothetical protein
MRPQNFSASLFACEGGNVAAVDIVSSLTNDWNDNDWSGQHKQVSHEGTGNPADGIMTGGTIDIAQFGSSDVGNGRRQRRRIRQQVLTD